MGLTNWFRGKKSNSASSTSVSNSPHPQPPDEARAEAKLNPGGWVYAIDARYNRDGSVPPEAIEGAWQVNEAGEIVGEFIPNHNFVPNHPKRVDWQHRDERGT
jgi:hypothetical protein